MATSSDGYMAHTRTERLIATGRALFAGSVLLLAWLRWGGMAPSAAMLYLEAAYAVYAAAVLVFVWSMTVPLFRLRLLTHVVDVSVFAMLYLSQSHLAGAFFIFFVFSLLSATMRWQWRGTLGTAIIVLGMAMVMGIYQSARSEDFVANRFMIRGVYLAVLSALMGYFVSYELNLRRDLSKIAAGPQYMPDDFEELLRDVLQEAADVLNAPRILLVINDADGCEPRVAAWSSIDLSFVYEPAVMYQPVVSETLMDADYYCQHAAVRGAPVIVRDGRRFRRVREVAAHPELLRRFTMQSVLSVRLTATSGSERLFWLDKPKLTADDLMLGRLVARGVMSRIQHFELIEQRKRAAGAEERIHLARNLHDGLLQSLTAISLKLQALRSTLGEGPAAVEKHLIALQALVLAEQRYVRQFIGVLKPGGARTTQSLGARLQLLCERVGLEWSLGVDWRWLDGTEPTLPPALADEVYYIVSEALVNAARHSGCSLIEVELGARDGSMTIVVADNGRGFPFQGRYDEAALSAIGIGPRVLGERVRDLSGRLTVESNGRGARIEVTLPLANARVAYGH